MTATLVAKNLAAGHGDRSLFTGLDLVVAPGDVIGLVGANGAGKSTLLRMLAGLTAPEQGELRLSPPTATVGHLPQEPERRTGETVRAFLSRRTGVTEAQRIMDEATQALVEGAPPPPHPTSPRRVRGRGARGAPPPPHAPGTTPP
ncbi:ATP-binding cassette domain-containing protein, partial [Streptomyces sp. NPDC058534]|uniref:ATP-binding cassette domain-containing protein n=1 Tax=Streptomyces sp. NPDC058534 TaxID=3346541 RepID=UPI00365981DA